MAGLEPRQTTSNIGNLEKVPIMQRMRGVGRYYYKIAINYRKNDLE